MDLLTKAFSFRATIWRYPGPGGWHFLSLPPEVAAQVRFCCDRRRSGWSSFRVSARIGAEEWQTSIFPETASQSMLLPIKAPIRKRLGLASGDGVDVELNLLGRG